MSDTISTIRAEMRDVSMKRPHIFILGAGASRAAFPEGDRNGNKLPLMCDLVEILKLEDFLEKNGIDYNGSNFESIYSNLYAIPEKRSVLEEIEGILHDYFAGLQLPDFPTIYDHLVLSLRSKDVIATFNWDPLLLQAWERNHNYAEMPKVLFLHGNVAVGYCIEHKKKSRAGGICSTCEKPLETARLLYPIEEKNYNNDPYISAEWETLRFYLKHAYILTIFGYGAPQSDVEAVSIMKEAWGESEQRELEQTEIIDIKSESELLGTWDPFICSHHYSISDNFYNSWVANHPRRSCEAMWNQLMECQGLDNNSIPRQYSFDDLIQWYQPLITVERSSHQA